MSRPPKVDLNAIHWSREPKGMTSIEKDLWALFDDLKATREEFEELDQAWMDLLADYALLANNAEKALLAQCHCRNKSCLYCKIKKLDQQTIELKLLRKVRKLAENCTGNHPATDAKLEKALRALNDFYDKKMP